MIFANHAHVFPKEIFENGTLDHLKKMMDDCGIDKAVAFAFFPRDSWKDNAPTEWLAKELKGQNDIVGFGTIDFKSKDLRAEVDRVADMGFKGIKLHPAYQQFAINSEEAFKVYERAEELGLFISFHCGMHWYRLADVRPILFDEVAWNFPKLRFSMEHLGGFHFFHEALAVMCNNSSNPENPTVFSGWTSVSDRDGLSAWTLTREQLETIILQTGEDRSIFGLDFPYKDTPYIQYEMERYRTLNISDSAKEKILGGTLKKILGM